VNGINCQVCILTFTILEKSARNSFLTMNYVELRLNCVSEIKIITRSLELTCIVAHPVHYYDNTHFLITNLSVMQALDELIPFYSC